MDPGRRRALAAVSAVLIAAGLRAQPEPAAAQLARAQQLFDELEYDQALGVATAVLERTDVDVDTRLDAHLLRGSAQAVVGDEFGAEQSFRLLLRGRPAFDLPGSAPPKILRVFRSVKAEEDRLRLATEAMQRQRLIEGIQIEGQPVGEPVGGQPLLFCYRVRDPGNAVRSVRVMYRRLGEPDYSAIALQLDATGQWRGALPGSATASRQGVTLQYFLNSFDADDAPLRGLGSPGQPLLLELAPGEVEVPVPFYRTLWFWGAMAAVAVATTGAGVGLWLAVDQATRVPEGDIPSIALP